MVAVPENLQLLFNELLQYGRVQFHKTLITPSVRILVADDYTLVITCDTRTKLKTSLYRCCGMNAKVEHGWGYQAGFRTYASVREVVDEYKFLCNALRESRV